ncbi:class I SAM-dependent RNA methyltransferase [Hoeflea poritis]|uniref:Class I SAM-dependent RNA methyltransferase n=1 Tax=Hoeflea poritis TaxID=2993659 RepID=A0ABT4VLC4_9HYPH|nr:class I SAM-dependent RNA methyltransferase [Hoeflea poritis]MDA4844838.1 class I SAM-dependent RNA methyltransferase [Hoeflea poritis]
MNVESVTIERLGAQGDGIATINGEALYVGFALPGETVAIRRTGSRGALVSVEEPSSARTDPPCRHFGPQGDRCGGCSLQHLDITAYNDWKKQLVNDALSARGIDADIKALITCQPGSRRRAVFSARAVKNGLVLGFNQTGTHIIASIEECAVLSPAIVAALPGLRKLAGILAHGGKPFRIQVLESLTGLDVAVDGIGKIREKARQDAIGQALTLSYARLSLGTEILVEARKPVLKFAGIDVLPPPTGFVQASTEAQEAMIDIVGAHLNGAKRIADLFSGCGTFALPLARQAAVDAAENDGAALKALDQAARHTPGLKPVTVERRDLFRRPLSTAELKKTDGVVFDPPRAGAQAQAREIAASGVSKVAAVSCNPATLARDLRILIDGGFRLVSVLPIDQFLWSPHVEAIALLER